MYSAPTIPYQFAPHGLTAWKAEALGMRKAAKQSRRDETCSKPDGEAGTPEVDYLSVLSAISIALSQKAGR